MLVTRTPRCSASAGTLSWASDSRRATSNAPAMISSALIDPRGRRRRMAFGAALGTVTPPVAARRRTLPGRRTRSLAASRKAYGMEHGIGKACGRLGSVGSAAGDAWRAERLPPPHPPQPRARLAFLSVVVGHRGDEPVVAQRGIHADLVGVLDQGPLALRAVHQLPPPGQRELADEAGGDLPALEAVAQDRVPGEPRVGDQVGAPHPLP